MVKVTFKVHHQAIVGVTLSGHANAGPHGQDLVCAAVSAIAFGTINALKHFCQTESSDLKINVIKNKISINVNYEQLQSAPQIMVVLETMKIQIETIAEQYHQFITINTIKE